MIDQAGNLVNANRQKVAIIKPKLVAVFSNG